MAYFPLKARSELVSRRSPGVVGLKNFSEGGVFDTTRRFQAASPAFIHPARRPTLGSGLGAVVDRSGCCRAATGRAAAAVSPSTSSRDLVTVAFLPEEPRAFRS